MSKFDYLLKRGLLQTPPAFLKNNVHYEVAMGSLAYGCNEDASDIDVYGFGIPPLDVIFPHLAGYIPGFDTKVNTFEQYQQHHIKDKEARKDYDLTIYSIVKYFKLVMDNNPNMIDSLFVPVDCILHCTGVGNMVREQRKLFLHKGSYHKFKGYAYSQLHKIEIKNPKEGTRRAELCEKFGYDVKFAYHVVRLLNESKQILEEGDLDLRRSKEMLKSIRRGDWSLEDIKGYFDRHEKALDAAYEKSTLPHRPDIDKIRMLLLQCLEESYGSLDSFIKKQTGSMALLNELELVIHKYR